MKESQRRKDIEGLRAIAILSVVIYHAKNAWLPSGFIGVDVFFVLSGFLITNLWMRERSHGGFSGLLDFWGRRILRLLPASTLVLVVTALTSSWWMPANTRNVIAQGIKAATLYWANWFFAFDALDYLAQDKEESPVLHFWSLGVEEQFYFVWPILFIVAGYGFHKKINKLRLLIVLSIITAASFAYSIQMVETEPAMAFFGTPSRIWELGIGALVAVSSSWWTQRSQSTRTIMSLTGIGMIIFALLFTQHFIARGFQFPGFIAVIPTLAAALLVASGIGAASPNFVQKVLSIRPAQWIGSVSYSWYLWHWPALIVLKSNYPQARSITVVAVVLLSLFLAWVSLKFVENPLRFSPWLKASKIRTFGLGFVLMAISFSSANFLSTHDSAVLEIGKVSYSPRPSQAEADIPVIYDDGCFASATTAHVNRGNKCVYGDRSSSQTIALVGDSHAAHWFGPIEQAARQEGFALRALIKTACPPIAATRWDARRNQVYEECGTWNDEVLTFLQEQPVDIIIVAMRTSGSITVFEDGEILELDDALVPWTKALKTSLTQLVNTGSRVVAISDTPFAPYVIPTCLADKLSHPENCDFARSEALLTNYDDPIYRSFPTIKTLNFVDRFCNESVCPAVINDVMVYRDRGHITNTFAMTFTQDFADLFASHVSN